MELTGKEIKNLYDMCGGEFDTEITLYYDDEGSGHSGIGLYAYHTEYPDEGAVFLSEED